MTFATWRYFLSLEDQFIRTLDYVDLSPDNSKTYSNEFAKLLLLAGSEVDVVAKQLCAQENPDWKREDIRDYAACINDAFDRKLHTQPVRFPYHLGERFPWKTWGNPEPTSPKWWRAYNNVKHERDKHFPDANQENVVEAMCGLLVLIKYLDHRNMPSPETKFFICEGESWLGRVTLPLPGTNPYEHNSVFSSPSRKAVDRIINSSVKTDMIKDGKGQG